MLTLKTIRMSRPTARGELSQLRAMTNIENLLRGDRPEIGRVDEIIRAVRERGDTALTELTERFDGVPLKPEEFRVPAEEVDAAWRNSDPDLMDAIRAAINGVRAFQECVLVHAPEPWADGGLTLHARYRPLRRVGVCVPGAAAPLPSSAIHCIVPAQVAGVAEIVLVAPPRFQQSIHPTTLAVAAELGVSEVYRIGGAQAVAAMALGTQTIGRVDKIVGPGGLYVQLAKRQLFGAVGIDMFAGPSEVVVIADESADPTWVAIDLLAQAEHDPGCAILITPDQSLADRVHAELDKYLPTFSTREGAQRSLETLGAILLVENLDQAAALADELAPEHLHVQTRNAAALADRIDSAGAIFIGPYSPEASGDYLAGPSHVLPTGGSARFSSGLSCNDFLRRTSIIAYTREAISEAAPAIARLADAEGLAAHARSATIRRSSAPSQE